MEYDDIVVGGGSAGAVLAARLSKARRVLLLEAGPDYPAVESTPADLRDGWRMSLQAHDWGLTAEAVPGRAIPYPPAAGSSAGPLPSTPRSPFAACRPITTSGRRSIVGLGGGIAVLSPAGEEPEGDAGLHGRGGPIAIARWRADGGSRSSAPFLRSAAASASPKSPTTTTRDRPAWARSRKTAGRFPCRRRWPTCCPPGTGPPDHPAALPGEPDPGRRRPGGGCGHRRRRRARRGSRAADHPGGRSYRLTDDPAPLGYRPGCRTGWLGHRASGRSAWRRRGPGRSPGHPAAGGAQAGQLRPADPARAGGRALHRPRLRRVQRHAAGHVRPAMSTWRASADGKRWLRWARGWRSGCPWRLSTPARAAGCCSPAPTRESSR